MLQRRDDFEVISARDTLQLDVVVDQSLSCSRRCAASVLREAPASEAIGHTFCDQPDLGIEQLLRECLRLLVPKAS